jgi:hypothetical protein
MMSSTNDNLIDSLADEIQNVRTTIRFGMFGTPRLHSSYLGNHDASCYRPNRALRLASFTPRSHDPPLTIAVTPHAQRMAIFNQHPALKPYKRQVDGPRFLTSTRLI